ncbi:MAG: hypothetical protein JNM34_06630 [Chthonomonadaceae bacterium]|nr:hypothetical protein [Chthonomonadaceae bacterium]
MPPGPGPQPLPPYPKPRRKRKRTEIADYNKLPDAQLSDWLANFATVAAANAAALGLTPTQVTSINTANTAFSGTMAAKIAAENAAKVATLNKNDQRLSSLVVIRTFANQFQANPSIPDSLIQALGLNLRTDDPTPRDVFQPLGLVAMGCDQLNSLKWDKNGNFPGTIYMIEWQQPGGAWEILTATTSAKFEHEGTTAGEQVSYRVYAQRGNKKSLPSNVSTVFSGGMPGGAELKVA